MKVDNQLIQYINLFEKITKSNVKDCFFVNEKLVFIVNEGHISKAIGKNGVNIKKIANLTKKKLKVVEFSSKIEKFIKSLIAPVKSSEIKVNENNVEISVGSRQDKGLLIGRDRSNLNFLKDILGKYFKIEDVKIL